MSQICDHETKSKALFDKHVKIFHKIYTKIMLLVKSTEQEINDMNFNIYLIQIMRELNKHNLKGYQKKQLAISIITLLLMELGLPHIVSKYTAEIIEKAIESIYEISLHKFKRPHKWRFWK